MNFYKIIFPVLFFFILISCKGNSTGPDPGPECDISVTPASVELGLGESETISASTTEGCSGSISWESSDSDIVSLNSNSGNSIDVTAKSEGDATIKASIQDQDGNIKEAKTDASIIFKSVVVYQKQTSTKHPTSDVWIADKNGNEKQVTNDSKTWDRLISPVQWIDNGERIAYLTYENDDVYSVNLKGQDEKVLTGNNVKASSFEVSHDGSKIAFEGDNENDEYGIHIQDLDTKETTLFVDGSRTEAPKWSPDDKSIAFTQYNISIENNNREVTGSDIHVKKSDGSGQSENLTNRSNTFDALPSWSPNGEKIAFISQGENSTSTHVINTDGSNEKVVADNFYCTSWISNNELACMAKQNGDDFDLYRVKLDGSYEILVDTPENEMFPDWKN